MSKIFFSEERVCEICIGENEISNVGLKAKTACTGDKAVIITDCRVDALYSERVADSLKCSGFKIFKYVICEGEKEKNTKTLISILEFLVENEIRRNDIIIGLGGGVVGDIAGFAASVYMRGVSWITIPTTLLAAVDSSIGGKTAVNLSGGKNMIGTFWQPSAVVCDLAVIRNIPETQKLEGLSEIIKYGIISKSGDILGLLETEPFEVNAAKIIESCAEIKSEYVRRDERDLNGIRAALNFGHTAAHAYEKISGYQISHGKAVGIGILTETRIAVNLNLCETALYKRLLALEKRTGVYTSEKFSAESVLNAMDMDKKNKGDLISFSLPFAIGDIRTMQIDKKSLKKAMNEA